MRTIKRIVIHCSDTYSNMNIGVKEIDSWHRQRGWSEIGYHYVVRRNGVVEVGRNIEKVGAHAKGYNSTSIAICWVGGKGDNNQPKDNRTEVQKSSLVKMVKNLKEVYPEAEVLGHRDLPGVTKACPCFNVKSEF